MMIATSLILTDNYSPGQHTTRGLDKLTRTPTSPIGQTARGGLEAPPTEVQLGATANFNTQSTTPSWDLLRDEPARPYYMMQPPEVYNLYFAASPMDKPDGTISKWLYYNLGGLPDAGLTPRHIQSAFYPLTYSH